MEDLSIQQTSVLAATILHSGNAKSQVEPVTKYLQGRQGQPRGGQVHCMHLSNWKG